MEVVLTAGAIGRAKLQSNHHPAFCRPDAFRRPTNSVRALKENRTMSVVVNYDCRLVL